jgi:hypothetical protein
MRWGRSAAAREDSATNRQRLRVHARRVRQSATATASRRVRVTGHLPFLTCRAVDKFPTSAKPIEPCEWMRLAVVVTAFHEFMSLWITTVWGASNLTKADQGQAPN